MIDTDVLIWYLRGNPKAYETIEKIGVFCISVITYMELVQGMRNKKELFMLRKTLKEWNVGILHIDEDISAKAMHLVEQNYLSSSLQLADALIAATALSHGLVILTGNVKHYKIVKNLEMECFNI